MAVWLVKIRLRLTPGNLDIWYMGGMLAVLVEPSLGHGPERRRAGAPAAGLRTKEPLAFHMDDESSGEGQSGGLVRKSSITAMRRT
ncbi:hypothetical protein AK812_SmicGene28472 [Symbiodinium microadriaticum]|uniref:Uncharacterized protein n=1 Tax=Symbiodinium microadriaticum TaxID=2951 RepID=A0A1Q9D4D5_SYMMI|nr:hypothetical protein AK812_SmicGene28472 [Symbiodinium microadriaticum]